MMVIEIYKRVFIYSVCSIPCGMTKRRLKRNIDRYCVMSRHNTIDEARMELKRLLSIYKDSDASKQLYIQPEYQMIINSKFNTCKPLNWLDKVKDKQCIWHT